MLVYTLPHEIATVHHGASSPPLSRRVVVKNEADPYRRQHARVGRTPNLTGERVFSMHHDC
jgi:hypothetical protein